MVGRVRTAGNADIPVIARFRAELLRRDHEECGLPCPNDTSTLDAGVPDYFISGYPARCGLPSFILERDGQLAGVAVPFPYDGIGVDRRGDTFMPSPGLPRPGPGGGA